MTTEQQKRPRQLRKRRVAGAMAEAMIRRHKKATKKKGCSWSAVVRDSQRALIDIMRAPDLDDDYALMMSNAVLNALPMIKGAVPRDVYEVVVRAAARLQYIGMKEMRELRAATLRPLISAPPLTTSVH